MIYAMNIIIMIYKKHLNNSLENKIIGRINNKGSKPFFVLQNMLL